MSWALVFAVLLYGSVLLHEISHALAARAFKMPVTSINLHFLGGATEIEGEAETPGREFVIAVVGPLTSLLVGAVAYFAIDLFDGGLLRFAVASLAGANLVVGVLNLVPGLPLDGGRVLQAGVWATHQAAYDGCGGRGLGWPGCRRGGGLLRAADHARDGLRADDRGLPGRVHARAFLWAGATHALQVSKLRVRLPGDRGASTRPAGHRRTRRPAAGRGHPARAGGPGRVDRGRHQRRAAHRHRATRTPSCPRRPTVVPGCRPLTSPGDSRTD